MNIIEYIISAVSDSTLLSSLSIIAGTFILEDATAATALLFVAQGSISAWIAIPSLTVGIFLSDMGLYFVGRLRIFRRLVLRLSSRQNLRKARRFFQSYGLAALIIARFFPGLRLPTYLSAGLLGMPFWHYCGVMTVSSLVWIGLLFGLFEKVLSLFPQDLETQTSIGIALIVILTCLPVTIRYTQKVLLSPGRN